MELHITKDQLRILKNEQTGAIKWYNSTLAEVTGGVAKPKRYLGKMGNIELTIDEEPQ